MRSNQLRRAQALEGAFSEKPSAWQGKGRRKQGRKAKLQSRTPRILCSPVACEHSSLSIQTMRKKDSDIHVRSRVLVLVDESMEKRIES